MTGEERWNYIPDRPGPRERHPVRRFLLVIGACTGVGFAIGWRLGQAPTERP